jgi:hypothetical protein
VHVDAEGFNLSETKEPGCGRGQNMILRTGTHSPTSAIVHQPLLSLWPSEGVSMSATKMVHQEAPATNSAPVDRPKLLLSGIDSLYLTHYLDTQHSQFDFEYVAFCRERLRNLRNSEWSEVMLGGEIFALKPHGMHPYTYVLANDALQIAIGERIQPSCSTQFYSEALWRSGASGVFTRFERWTEKLNLWPTRAATVSRVDFAFDYALPNGVDFTADHFVSRAKKDASFRANRKVQTFVFGRGDVVIRIYDKAAEIREESHKTWFYQLWGQEEDVWRIEFQVRRDRLREAGIDCFSDLLDLQGDLLRDLAVRHTTLRRPNSDSNRARWPFHPLWRALLDDIARLPQTGMVRPIDPQKDLSLRMFHQARSIYGDLKGLGALLSEAKDEGSPLTLEALLARLPSLLARFHHEGIWQQEVQRRIIGRRLGQW